MDTSRPSFRTNRTRLTSLRARRHADTLGAVRSELSSFAEAGGLLGTAVVPKPPATPPGRGAGGVGGAPGPSPRPLALAKGFRQRVAYSRPTGLAPSRVDA
jgi:hypothetical protein